MPNTMRQQAMGGPNPNAQMNMNPSGGMVMGGMGGMNRGFGMNEHGHMGHMGQMGQMGGCSAYGGSSGGGAMGNRMMQMSQMGHMSPMNNPSQGMQHHPHQPPFQSSGGFGLSGLNSPSGSPRMGAPQSGLLMSPRNRGSPKMGANQFSPAGESVLAWRPEHLFMCPLACLIILRFFPYRHALSHGWHLQWWRRRWEHYNLLQQLP